MTDLNLSTAIIEDSNHPMRRFFRCWIDGSYDGPATYQANREFIRHAFNSDKRLRAFVIGEWCDYLAREHDCTPSTIRRHMVRTFTDTQLEALNAELIDDARDLVRDEMETA